MIVLTRFTVEGLPRDYWREARGNLNEADCNSMLERFDNPHWMQWDDRPTLTDALTRLVATLCCVIKV